MTASPTRSAWAGLGRRLLPTLGMALVLLLGGGPDPSSAQVMGIAAVVNGEAITTAEVASRTRLFTLSAGNAQTSAERLTPQIVRLLVDERLRLQEMQRRNIVVGEKDIADAIARIEKGNNLPEGGLRAQLARSGVEFRVMVDQIRTQIGWSRLVLSRIGEQGSVTQADIDDRLASLEASVGQPEFLVSEIFIPAEDPTRDEDAQRFAGDVISQLKTGTPFPLVATQFSQAASAAEGGDLGWVRESQVDPEVATIIAQMPVGAVANPIRTAGGLTIVSLRGRREVGRDIVTMASIRQIFLPFQGALDPANPTPAQRTIYDRAQALGPRINSCAALEEAAKTQPTSRPVNPGPIVLERQAPPIRAALMQLSSTRAQVIGTQEGMLVWILCDRKEENLGVPSRETVAASLRRERIDQSGRTLMRDLRRRALIDVRA